MSQATFTFAGARSTGIDEQSAITFVSREHGFLVIADDTSKVFRVAWSGGRVETIRRGDRELDGLEGCTFDQETRSLLVVSEDSRRVHELKAREENGRLSLGAPDELGRLDKLGASKNKSWEGLTVVPGKGRILAAHERDPRGVGVFDRFTLELYAFVELPASMSPHPRDLSDLAIDPRTGHLFLLSDDSGAVFEVALREGTPWTIEPIADFAMPAELGELQIEGVTFDDDGDLWISGEKGSRLLFFKRG